MTARILTISKPYVAAAYRDKLKQIAALGQMKMGLICPPAWGNQTFESPNKGDDKDLWIRTCPIRFNNKNHFHYYVGIKKLIKEFSPDVINCEEEHYSLVTFQVMKIAKSMGIPCLFYTWQNILKRYPPPFSWIESYVFKHCMVGIAGNQEAKDILVNKGFKYEIPVIPQMGVRLNQFQPPANHDRLQRQQELNFPKGLQIMGFVGRLVKEKGIQDVLNAMTKLNNLGLVILGSGPFKPELIQLASQLGIQDRVDFRGSIPSNQVAHYMQGFDYLCLPSHTRSNWKEQFGRVLPEAMAAGAIPVGSNSGEIPSVIANAGIVFKEGDADDLSAQLEDLMGSTEKMKELQRKALKRCLENYTNTKIASHFTQAFQLSMQPKQQKNSHTKLNQCME